MMSLQSMLVERREEYETHFALASALQDRIFKENLSLGDFELSARHLLTLQSGLVIHLYNIVEATMTRASDLVGVAVGASAPRAWSKHALLEWLRKNAVLPLSAGEVTRLNTVHSVSVVLMADSPPGTRTLKKPSGTWSDVQIETFAERLGVPFMIPSALEPRIEPQSRYGDVTPLCFLAKRRNDIAHGQRTFESGCNDLTLQDIQELADVVFDYLGVAADAFQNYVDGQLYLAVVP